MRLLEFRSKGITELVVTMEKILVLVVAILITQSSSVIAGLITFNISSFGTLQSGPVSLGPMSLEFQYQFDSSLVDREPSVSGGSYEAYSPALLKLGTESFTSSFGYGIFMNVSSPQSYTVAISYPYNQAFFQGRELVSAVFNFISLSSPMLVDDKLPTDPSFALKADRYFTRLTFFAAPGDPNFGISEYTQFDLIQQGSNAPLTLAAVPEPTSIAIWGIGALGMGLVARRRSKKAAAV